MANRFRSIRIPKPKSMPTERRSLAAQPTEQDAARAGDPVPEQFAADADKGQVPGTGDQNEFLPSDQASFKARKATISGARR